MASDTEEVVCWQCSEYMNIFPELMATIQDMWKKRKRTNEDNIIQEIISNGNTEITDKHMINSVFEYAVGMHYISQNKYGNHFYYKINSEIAAETRCKDCGEKIIPFLYEHFKVETVTRYVDLKTFESLANEIVEIKKLLRNANNISIDTERNEAENHYLNTKVCNCDNLQSEIEQLRKECTKKDETINILTQNVAAILEQTKSIRSTTKDDEHWFKDKRSLRNTTSQRNTIPIPLTNRFNGMPIEEIQDDEDTQEITTSQPSTGNNIRNKKHVTKKVNNKVYVNYKQDNDLLLLPNVAIPQKSFHNKLCEENSKQQKIVILSASITRPINMIRFNNKINNGYAVKRAYGGATTTRLKHCARAAIEEDKPDTMILNAGTNNFSKTNQTAEEIVNDIFEIVDICRQGGVNQMYVSSITCRPQYQDKVDAVNDLLQAYGTHHNYDYIDNSEISEFHLKRDGVHLNPQGVNVLEDNFLYYLNRPVSSPFVSFWDTCAQNY